MDAISDEGEGGGEMEVNLMIDWRWRIGVFVCSQVLVSSGFFFIWLFYCPGHTPEHHPGVATLQSQIKRKSSPTQGSLAIVHLRVDWGAH